MQLNGKVQQTGMRGVRSSRRAQHISASMPKPRSRTDALRDLLKGNDILKGPCCHDALSARLIERAGFDFAFMSGFCTSASRLGAPDTGLISYAEMVDQGRYMHEATRALPIIGDGDTGYGNAMNVKRTVKGYAAAGFAGILIEDQVAPKSCGHVRGKQVTSREEAVSRIRAAADARDEGSDILIVARTDARQAVSLEEALWRVAAFADAGADVLFIDALESVGEMRAFCGAGGGAAALPKMANNLEGGGKTPVLPSQALQDIGFKLVAYPLSLLGVSIRAMENALQGLKVGRVPEPRDMGTFVDIQMAVGFPEYYEESGRYALSNIGPGSRSSSPRMDDRDRASSASPAATGAGEAAGTAEQNEGFRSTSPGSSTSDSSSAAAEAAGATQQSPPVVEADSVSWQDPGTSALMDMAARGRSSYGSGEDAGSSGAWDALRRSRFFRVKISDTRSKLTKLETRIPAGFLAGLTALVPQVAGINFDELLEQAMGGKLDLSKPISELESGDSIIQIFLE